MESAVLDAQNQNLDKQQRLSQLESGFARFQKQIQFLFMYTTSLFSRVHRKSNDQASQLQQQTRLNESFTSQFCGFFGVKPEASSVPPVADTPVPDSAALACGSEDAAFAECFERWQGQKVDEERQTE